MKLVLASGSPRRRRLLEAFGLDFEVCVSGVDESTIEAGSPRAFALKAASLKAEDVFAAAGRSAAPGTLILAADTIVVLDEAILGKPADRADAAAMLRRLSGRTHRVITGMALRQTDGPSAWLDAETTEVALRELNERDIEAYVAGGGADDKAGAYGIQEVGDLFIAAVRGDLSNVIGLPMTAVRRGLIEMAGCDLFDRRRPRTLIGAAFPELRSLPESAWSGLPD